MEASKGNDGKWMGMQMETASQAKTQAVVFSKARLHKIVFMKIYLKQYIEQSGLGKNNAKTRRATGS